ncbi:MAG: hypothetical protein IPM29_29000 [Planctomycetes bacterium]|nr:hypothetical protein [Planctomycetota bacterium]
MSIRSLFAVAAIALTGSFQPLTAQGQLTVNPGVLVAGDDAVITFSDPSKAGETVTIEIDNGSFVNPRSSSVEIRLDDSGTGSARWTVPDDPYWIGAHFTGPSGPSVSRGILPGEEPPPGETPPGGGSPLPAAPPSAESARAE